MRERSSSRNAVAVIPARIASSRFPGKVLAPICGLPMIAHVVRRARQARRVSEVWVATDDAGVGRAAAAEGARVAMTSSSHVSGTDRVAEAARQIGADVVLNLQGDEPLIDPRSLDRLAGALLDDPGLEAVTLAFPIASDALFVRPDVVKVVLASDGTALYFSRAPVPADRERPGRRPAAGALKHLGVYGFRGDVLARFAALAPSPLEQIEGLEQLRLLEHGVRMRVLRARVDSVAVDRPEDIARVEAILAGKGAVRGGTTRRQVRRSEPERAHRGRRVGAAR